MKTVLPVVAVLGTLITCHARLFTFTRDNVVRYTAKNPFGQFEDGRPRVPDDLLEKVRELSSEDIWSVLSEGGYQNQYEGNWQILHPGKKLVGRAVTAQYMPTTACRQLRAELVPLHPMRRPLNSRESHLNFK
jgi:4-hydroxy-4-methyl-2-oxoglutarate aldolase